MSTSAVEVSIHAVSPELSLSVASMNGAVGVGAVAAALGAATADAGAPDDSSACTTGVHAMSNPRMRPNLIIDATPLNGAGVPLARSDAHHVRERENEYLAIAHFAGARGLLNRLDHLIHQRIGHGDFDLGLRHDLDDVLRAPVNLGMAA